MIISLRGIKALQQLRIEHQEATGLEFPQVCLVEMMSISDVCRYLVLSLCQVWEVLGLSAHRMVTARINGVLELPTEQAIRLLHSSEL